MLKTNKTIKNTIFATLLAIFIIPTIVSAGSTGSYGSDSWGGDSWGSWGGNSPTYGYTYTPNYSYTPSYGGGSSYGGSSYTPSYGGGSSYGGSSYTPSYGGYSLPTYGGSSIPSSNTNSNSNQNTNTSGSNSTSSSNQNQNSNSGATSTSTSGANSNATSNPIQNTNVVSSPILNSTSSAMAINNNNVYVYTNPTGNAVVYNPQHQYLNVYCVITPSNPRTGQVVTATAYASGGTGNYTYSWSGDIYTTSGPSTTFTSYTTGTKNITVTARSGQEIITKSCDVTFVNDTQNNNELSAVCFANPTNATVNQVVTWTVNVNGGNGGYSYNWSGTDGLTGYNQYTSRQYTYTGIKNAYVTVTANGRTVTANCSTNVNGFAGTSFTGSSVNLTPNITTGTPVSGVFLGDLPATGLSLGFVEYMVGFMMIILATVFTFIYQARKRLMTENA
jgi:hypothetical protein